jgi:hypothetical protein
MLFFIPGTPLRGRAEERRVTRLSLLFCYGAHNIDEGDESRMNPEPPDLVSIVR